MTPDHHAPDHLALGDLKFLAGDLGTPKVRDSGLLDSAAHRPRTSVLGEDAYPGVFEKAAVLLQSIVRNHPLIDGNKRLGWMSAFVFLGLNGHDLDAPEDDAYDLVIGVATGAVPHTDAAVLLESWSRPAGVDTR